MSELLGRAAEVNIGGTLISGLRIGFDVERSLAREPNTAEVSVYNLSESTRQKMTDTADLTVSVRAGYGEQLEDLFLGDVTHVSHERSAADWVTTVEAGDGVRAIRRSRVNLSFGPGTAAKKVLEDVARCAQLKIGNSLKKAADGGVDGIANEVREFLGGRMVSGRCYDQLENIAGSMGYRVSVQDGALQLLGDTETTTDQTAEVISPDTGMVGSPVRAENDRVNVRSLLRRNLLPGRKVRLESRDIEGFFRVERSQFVGDTHTMDWYVDLEVKRL